MRMKIILEIQYLDMLSCSLHTSSSICCKTKWKASNQRFRFTCPKCWSSFTHKASAHTPAIEARLRFWDLAYEKPGIMSMEWEMVQKSTGLIHTRTNELPSGAGTTCWNCTAPDTHVEQLALLWQPASLLTILCRISLSWQGSIIKKGSNKAIIPQGLKRNDSETLTFLWSIGFRRRSASWKCVLTCTAWLEHRRETSYKVQGIPISWATKHLNDILICMYM